MGSDPCSLTPDPWAEPKKTPADVEMAHAGVVRPRSYTDMAQGKN